MVRCGGKHAKWIVNLVVFFIVVTLIFVLLLGAVRFGSGKPIIRCSKNETDDPRISYPYRKETISDETLIAITLCLPLLEFLVTEWFADHQRTNPNRHNVDDRIQNSKFDFKGRLKRAGKIAAYWSQDYVSAYVFLELFLQILKAAVPAPRPYWIDSCRPQFPPENCIHGLVTEYECTNQKTSQNRLLDAQKSFPSGHAAASIFTSVFMIVYIECRLISMSKKFGVVLRLGLHFLWLMWGALCSMSRVTDYRHHSGDVIAGVVLGGAWAVFVSVFVCQKFRRGFRELPAGIPTSMDQLPRAVMIQN